MKKTVPFIFIALYLLIYVFEHYNINPEKKIQKESLTHTSLPIEKIKTIAVLPNTPHLVTQVKTLKKESIIDIFEEEDIDFVNLKIKQIKDVTPIAAVRMETNKIKTIKVGENLLLPTIDGNSYTLKVKHHTVSQRGTVSIDGDFSENGNTYSAILTEGKKSAFISMSTPTGMYEIELIDGLGYIYTSSEIENAKIDFSQSDILDHKI
jgi:hypothetical protein